MPCTEAAVEAFAEAPAAAGDNRTALARWDEAWGRGLHPAAAVFRARYLALTGRTEEAQVAVADLLRSQADVSLMLAAVRKLYVRGLGDAWVRVAGAVSRTRLWRGTLRERVTGRVLRADFLFALDEEARGIALRLIREAGDSPVEPGPFAGALAFVGCLGTEEDLAAFISYAPPLPDLLKDAVRAVLAEETAGSLPRDAALRFAARFGTPTDDPDTAAGAGFPPAEPGSRPPGVATALHATGDAAFRLLEAFPDEDIPAPMVRRAVAAALATDDRWVLARRVALLRDRHPAAPGPAVLAAELAAATGDAGLSLARSLARLLAGGPASAVLEAAARLVALGYLRPAAAVLAPHAAGDEDVAYRCAQILSRVAPEARSSAPWRAATAAHDTPRLKRGLALALADEGDHATAEALYADSVGSAEATSVWRPWATSLERAGNYAGWADLLARLEERTPAAEWIAGERMKLRLETEAHIPSDLPAATVGRATRLELRRTMARVLSVKGSFDEVVALWRGIAAETGEPDDGYGVIMALCLAGAFDEAAAALDRLLAAHPGDYRLHVKRAQLHERIGSWEAALGCFATSFDLEPANRDGLVGIARCLTYLGAHARCANWLAGVPDEGAAHLWKHAALAFDAARRGRADEAAAAVATWHARAAAALDELTRRSLDEPNLIWTFGRESHGSSLRVGEAARRFAADLEWLRGGSIVLVGNSPRLLGTGHGPRVDGFERTIRLNDFQTEGHEADVGRRTDLWFSSANRLAKPNVRALEGTRIWLNQPYPRQIPDLPAFAVGRLGLDLDPTRATFLPPHAHVLSNGFVYPRPSTGFRVMIMLELMVRRPYSIVGFSFFQDAMLHYFEQEASRFVVGEVHALEFERDFVREVLCHSPFHADLERPRKAEG